MRLAVSAAAVALVTGAIFGLREVAPVLSLGVLYIFAVLPVAVFYGLAYALGVSIASMLAFNFFFLPPLHSFALTDSENWVALAVYLVTAVVVSELAARSRRRAGEAEQREREAAFLAEVSALLLEREDVQGQLREIGRRLAVVLDSPFAHIELGSLRRPEPQETVFDLAVGTRRVGRVFLAAGSSPPARAPSRLLPALASLLAVASERERLAREAVEAETLRRSDAIKTTLLRAVSHDLRSPLTAIRAASDGLSSSAIELGPEDRGELLETIRLETRRLERLVSNLLDLSQLEVGAARPRPELWTIDTLVGSALDDLGSEARRVRVAIPADLPPVRVDAGQIERVLANVLENALRFTPVEESVEVTARETRAEVEIRVVDRGPGLSKEDAERVFEPFERAGGGQGSGLGLAIARGFAQANASRLWVESRPGRGATFVLALPAVADRAPVRA